MLQIAGGIIIAVIVLALLPAVLSGLAFLLWACWPLLILVLTAGVHAIWPMPDWLVVVVSTSEIGLMLWWTVQGLPRALERR